MESCHARQSGKYRHVKSAARISEICPRLKKHEEYHGGKCNISRDAERIIEGKIGIEILRHYHQRRPDGERKSENPYFPLPEKARIYIYKIYRTGDSQKRAYKPREIKETEAARAHLGNKTDKHHHSANRKADAADERRYSAALSLGGRKCNGFLPFCENQRKRRNHGEYGYRDFIDGM